MVLSKEVIEEIRSKARGFAANNALQFGKANENAVFGRVMGSVKDAKQDISKVRELVLEAVNEINSLDREKLEKFRVAEKEKKLLKTELPELEGAVKGKVVTRIAPAPSGYLHVAHIFAILLNSEYAKKYKGRFILRIEDTNASNVDKDAYVSIPNDVEWITGLKPEVYIQSDRMELYYKRMEELFKLDGAYVCRCSSDDFREFVSKKKACPHRDNSVEKNLEEWRRMFKEYKEGEAVVRCKSDINHPNPAVRDFPIFRINDDEHPRTKKKYRVWPLMNFSVSVDDHEMGLTHVIRGKDHIINMERQKYIFDYFGWKTPYYIHTGRLNFKNFEMSKTKTRQKILKGEYEGWDDPRLPFLVSFRKRGFNPESFRRFVVEMGPSKRDKTTTYEEFMKKIESYNREIVEPIANRYFFIEDPVELEIDYKPIMAEIPLHPDFPERGSRTLKFGGKVFISKKDFDFLKKEGKIRLKNLFTINNKFEVIDESSSRIVQWLPADNKLKGEIITDKGVLIKGIIEENIKKEKGKIVQLERMFFAKIDKLNKVVKLYYLHK